MIIACPACSTRYAVPDSAIGVDGRTVRCAKCRHSWFQEGPALQLETAQAAPVSRPAAVPVPPVAPASPPPAPPRQEARQAPEAEPEAGPRIGAPGGYAAEPDEEPPPPPMAAPRQSGRAAIYDDGDPGRPANHGPSSFDFAPPFRPRRNWTKIGTYAAGTFAVVTLGLTGVIAWGGLPDWVPIPRATFQRAQPDLQLDFPRARQDRKPLPDGSEFFSVSGTISNIGSEARYVPSLLVVLRDQRERIVYEKEIVPPKHKLAPGETLTINEALTDIPKAASAAEIGWKPD
ncbi:MJ0042 family finger-like domain-containing protein [Novosphingobium sp. CF614]|uniref:zinc-ribbon domain-containing protein n=1 Tax=Novosphingobium sp. CF614 TaxID=1884364 RepID=UPI0008F22E00|nr:zinc-ribbon domain-containing protein [Novosphingobium sp. CF614]SFG38224.1 MJ0042 family finger-like domain-containing protein [Novosphingobium sp. CF614]